MRPLRITLCAMVSVAMTIALGQVQALAQPLTNPAAGEYHVVTHEAGFNFFDPSSGTFVTIDVTNTATTSAPSGTAPSTTETTVLNLEIFGGVTGQQGCYDIAPDDFSFGSGSATLHTMVTDSTPSCTQPFQTPPTPPFSVDVTWTGNGPAITNQGTTIFRCGSYSLETATSSTRQGAAATADITPILAGDLAGQGGFVSDDTRQHASGTMPNNCQPFGAIAGGAGPPPAGQYRTSSITTDFFTTTDSGLFVDLNVMQNSQTSTPRGGVTTTTNQIQLGIDEFGNGTFGNGCFQLTPSQFTSNGVQSAAVSLTIDQSTPMCFPGGQTNLPLPLSVKVTWTGSGPVATTRSTGSFTCLTYRETGTSLNVTNNANVSVSLPQLLPNPLSGPGTLATSSSDTHAEGAQQPPCHL